MSRSPYFLPAALKRLFDDDSYACQRGGSLIDNRGERRKGLATGEKVIDNQQSVFRTKKLPRNDHITLHLLGIGICRS